MNLFGDKNVYSESSGVCTYRSNKIRISLNKYGIYQEEFITQPSDIEIEDLKFISPNFNDQTNESKIAQNIFSEEEGIKVDDTIGYYISTYVGYVVEGDYRQNASSGGIGTWIFKALFEKGLIDGVIHVIKNKDENSQVLFKYGVSKNIDDIKKGSKTKYYPVELSEVLNYVKNNDGKYAIIGIPSFIYALRLLSQKDEIIESRIKYFIGIICGHQKSSKFAESMAWEFGIKPGDLKNIDFRFKLQNEKASNYGVKFCGLINNEYKEFVKPKREIFGQDWGMGFFKQFASDFTDDVMNETADITLGDAWLPKYENDYLGTNVVIVRRKIIDDLLQSEFRKGNIYLEKVEPKVIIESQKSHIRHTRDELCYRLYKRLRKTGWVPQKRVKPSKKLSVIRRKIQDLRETISRKSHDYYLEALSKDDYSIYVKKMTKLTRKYNRLYKIQKFLSYGFVGTIKRFFSNK